jgi:hydroxymethylpyrimidine pyrophosphatase-like HAD family hydrolase
MRYLALATDYDGTLAHDGTVSEGTLRALENLKASGRKLLLVTGRHLPDLQSVFPHVNLFDQVVAENGALLYDPATHSEKVLSEAPPEEFLSALREAGIRFDVGQAIISSWTPHETRILEVIHRLALEYQVIFNKGAVMVLPSGVNKATGLRAGLDSLQLSFHNVIAVGDAENDHAFLSASECGVAVANALPALKKRADIVTQHDHGEGVAELIEQLLQNDLQSYDDKLTRSSIVIGTRADASRDEIRIAPNRNSVLVAGASASGKSSAVAGILEELCERGYQFCLIDPEGDFENFAGALSIGSPTEQPDAAVIAKGLESQKSVIVNLMGVSLRERPHAFTALLPRILESRSKTARPHWLVIDEAHHLMPANWSPASSTIPQELGGTVLITVHPEHVSAAALAFVDVVIAKGNGAGETLAAFATATQISAPSVPFLEADTGHALVWFTKRQGPPLLVKTRVAKSERRRHRRNYAQGELSPEQSFYFRGPQSNLNLRAQNLSTFLQLAEGIDNDTWLFHLRKGDFSQWFQTVIKDDELAACARVIEADQNLDVAQARDQLKQAIESRYTAPA